jgi:hypothetical protein
MKNDNLYSSPIIIRVAQFRRVWWSCMWHPWSRCEVLTVFSSENSWEGDHLWYVVAGLPYIMHFICDWVWLSHAWVAIFIGLVWLWFVIVSYLVFHGYDWACFMSNLTTWVCDRVRHTRLAWLRFVIELHPGFHGCFVSDVNKVSPGYRLSVIMIELCFRLSHSLVSMATTV